MTPESLFHAALDKADPVKRAAFLDGACLGQPELREQVEMLLAAHADGSNPLDRPPGFQNDVTTANDRTRSFNSPDPTPGVVVAGRYTLEQKLGEGGMGEVWVAKQSEPVKRKVALKFIKTGMDSRAVLTRFEQERQALAVMDHPNIARVFDGGLTQRGTPYFVMELVAGLPLNKYCDEARLPIQDRLQLFVSICQAVQHAHQKGIVHRDLKPGNILVTMIDGKPTPKIIDFGVAKAISGKLTDDSLSTQFGAVIGTMEYMAPEQAGLTTQDVDTRADIYSLGVILFEMLTGLRPFDSKRLKQVALDEVIRILREEEPPSLASRLSTDDSLPSMAAVRQIDPKRLLSLVKGELDWIVHKCLEKERNRRYDTANGLARDVQRYLADEPVEARPVSLGYRLKKLVKRNRMSVIAGALIFLSLIGGIIGTSIGLILAQQAQGEAMEQEKEAKKNAMEAKKQEKLAYEKLELAIAVSQFLQDDILGQAGSAAQADRNYQQNPHLTIREALNRATVTVGERFKNRRDLEACIRNTIGNAYVQVADFQSAASQLRQAQKLFHELNGELDQSYIMVTYHLATALYKSGANDESITFLEKAHRLATRLMGETDRVTLSIKDTLALVYRYSGRLKDAIRIHEEIREIEESKQPPNPRDQLATLNNLGQCYLADGQVEKALKLYLEAKRGFESILAADHPNLLTIEQNIGTAYVRLGKLEDAIKTYRGALQKRQKQLGPYHQDTIISTNALAVALNNAKRHREALELFEQVRQAVTAGKLAREDSQAAIAIEMSGIAYYDSGQFDKAITLYRELLAYRRKMLGDKHLKTHEAAFNLVANLLAVNQLDEAIQLIADWLPRITALPIDARNQGRDRNMKRYARNVSQAVYTKANRDDLLIVLLKENVSIARQQMPQGDPLLGSALAQLALTQIKLKQFTEAESALREACTIREARQPDEWTTFNAKSMLGFTLLAQRRYAEAEPVLLAGYSGMKERAAKIPPEGKARLREAIERLIQLYTATNKPDELARWKKELEILKASANQVKP